MSDDSRLLAELTTTIVKAFVGKTPLSPSELPTLIASVHNALKAIAGSSAVTEPPSPTTAAQIRKSITPDGLISFIDGRPYKMLKRHLTANGLTIADYKVKFGLPDDYPTTSAHDSAMRSALAKAAGLGRGGRGSSKSQAETTQRRQ